MTDAVHPNPSETGGPRRWILVSLAWLAILLVLSASWLLAFRLRFGEGNSFYTYGYVGDEYLYAQRIQPLVGGATATNPVNGLTDPAIISPFYLEDMCRAIIRASGLDVLTFMWIWRWIFPLVLALSLLPLVLTTLPRRPRTWTQPFRLAGFAAGVALLYLIYDFVTEFPPLQGFLQRIPTNIEYPLSLLMAWACIAFTRHSNALRGATLGIVSVAMIYLRLYAALPWGLAIATLFLLGLARRELTWKGCLAAAAVVVIGLLPWIYVSHHNSASEVYRQMLKRYFIAVPYSPHPQWKLMLLVAETMIITAWATPRHRSFMIGCAVSMIIMPFICGLLPVARELLNYDRFGVFYLVALIACGLLWLGEQASTWRGGEGALRAKRWSLGLAGTAAASGVLLCAMDGSYKLNEYPAGPLKFIQPDVRLVPAYEYLRDKTPENSLVLVDDGTDWLKAEREGKVGKQMDVLMERDDLCQIVARRRVIYTNRLFTVAIPDEAMLDASTIQFGTFGLTDVYSLAQYKKALAGMTPDYVLWRKSAGVPRGYGAYLQRYCENAYEDDACVIWRVKKEDLLAAIRSEG